MNSLLPPPTPEIVSAYAILALIADPAAAKARLDELAKASSESARMLADAQSAKKVVDDLQAAARSAQTTIDRTAADIAAKQETMAFDFGQRKDKLDALEQSLNARSKMLGEVEAKSVKDIAARQAELDTRDQEVTNREAAVTSREAAVAQTSAAVDALKADYEARMAVIQQLAKGGK